MTPVKVTEKMELRGEGKPHENRKRNRTYDNSDACRDKSEDARTSPAAADTGFSLGESDPNRTRGVASRQAFGTAPKYPTTHALCVFFFQAEDGIRDVAVTGVQTCALPIYVAGRHGSAGLCLLPGGWSYRSGYRRHFQAKRNRDRVGCGRGGMGRLRCCGAVATK